MTRSLLWSVAALALLGAAGPQQEPEDSQPYDVPDDMEDFREDPIGANTPEEARLEAALEEAGTGGAGPGEEQAPPDEAPQEDAEAQPQDTGQGPRPESR